MQIELKSDLKLRFQAEKTVIIRQNELLFKADSRTMAKFQIKSENKTY